MGWLDNLWRRRQGRTTETSEDVAQAQKERAEKSEDEVADELEQDAHRFRDEEIFREPRKPPGTG
jgi:hypothetical protein